MYINNNVAVNCETLAFQDFSVFSHYNDILDSRLQIYNWLLIEIQYFYVRLMTTNTVCTRSHFYFHIVIK